MEYAHQDQPAAKKVRLGEANTVMSDDDFSDPDDFFDTPAKPQSPQHEHKPPVLSSTEATQQTTRSSPHAVPGLSLLPSVSPPAAQSALPPAFASLSAQAAPDTAGPTPSLVSAQPQILNPSQAPSAPIAPEPVQIAEQEISSLPPPQEDLAAAQKQDSVPELSTKQPSEDVRMLDAEESAIVPGDVKMTGHVTGEAQEPSVTTAGVPESASAPSANGTAAEGDLQTVAGQMSETASSSSKQQAPIDPDFLAAAEANKGEQNAEWQYDSSDAESSDTSSDSSDDDSDDDSDADDYVLLDPREQARILMAEEEGGEDGGGSKKKEVHLRTANEKPDEIVEKPDIPMTPETVIKELGIVEIVVENYALVKGTLSAETQVLESGSALCLESRTVIGAVQEPIGRVEEPRYSVAFTNAKEIADYGITVGTKIFYVPEFSTYVFTQALKLMKGTDASNVHDEEVGPDEIEFSDDEAEAEYKRQLKQDKLIRKGIIKPDHMKPDPETQSGFSIKPDPDAPLKYDEDDDDDMYQPLSRPADLGNTAPPPRSSNGRGNARGRGQDRGRGGRGRGDRGRGGRGRGDQQNSSRGHDSRGSQRPRHPDAPALMSSPLPSQPGSSQPDHVGRPPPAFTGLQGYQGYQGQPGAQQQFYNPAYAGGGFPDPMPQYPQQMGHNVPPPGSFINPAFWANLQAQMQSQNPNQQQQGYRQHPQQRGYQQHPQQGNNQYGNNSWGR